MAFHHSRAGSAASGSLNVDITELQPNHIFVSA
jgi:hypothetical protein